MLAVLLAYAASSWEPACSSKSDQSLWWIFTGAPGTTSLTNDYSCKGLFFGSISCPTTVGLGRIYQTGVNSAGYSEYELRYLPYGDTMNIMSFFQKPGLGVLFTPPPKQGDGTLAAPPPATRDELLKMHLEDRVKSSAATMGITLHVWQCAESSVAIDVAWLESLGMKLDMREAPSPLVEQ